MTQLRPLEKEPVLDFLRRIFGERPQEATIVVTYKCRNCEKSHVAEIATTVSTPESVISILSLGILDVVDTYAVLHDENPHP